MNRPRPAEEVPVALSRWQGGKRWLVEQFADRIPLPRTPRGRFFDVFTGSAVLTIHVLKLGRRVVMGDTNPRLISAYAHLQSDPRAVVNALEALAEEYEQGVRDGTTGSVVFYRLRDRLNASEPFSLESAALFLFVMNAGFNGLYRVNKRGVCNTTFGNPKPGKDLVRAGEMRALGKLLRRATPLCLDFAELCEEAKRGDTAFFDPPYVTDKDRSGFVSYSDKGFRRFDLQRLGATLRDLDRRGVRWSLTDGNSQVAGETHGLWNVREVQVRRSGSCKAKGRGMVREMLVSNW
jgi:DNA adenine methylase